MFILALSTGTLFLPALWAMWTYLLVILFAKYATAKGQKNIAVSDATIRDGKLTIEDVTAVLPFWLPPVEIAFRDNRAPASARHIAWLQSMGADTVKVFKEGRSVDVFRLRTLHLTEPEILEVLGMKDHVDHRYSATANYINISSLQTCLRLREQMSIVALAQYNFHSDPGHSPVLQSLSAKAKKSTWTMSTTNDDELGDMAAESESSMYSVPTQMTLGLAAGGFTSVGAAWGGMDTKPAYGGIAFPFVNNYANPDPDGINWFMNVSSRLFSGYGNLVDVTQKIIMDYRRDIFGTTFGLYMAHYCKVLELGLQVGSPVYAFICPEQGYCGCFFGGEHFRLVRGDGAQFEGVKPENTDLEWASLSIHETTLDKIRVIAGLPDNWDKPKTMRRLRTMVFAGGKPSGMVQNQISELLSDLVFPEKHDPVNSSSMVSTIELLTSETLVPDIMYLDRRSFWAEDRMTLVLARFGAKPPSWSTGGRHIRFTEGAHGEGIQKAEAHSATAPVPLQVTRKPIRAAVFDWTHLLNTGFTGIATVEMGEAAFTFRGGDRTVVWNSLGSRLGMYMSAHGQGTTTTSGSNKRGLEEGEVEESEGNVADSNKKKRFW
jgi:hypothetical protein